MTLLKSIAPGSSSWSIARTNSVAEAAGSLSGSVASGVKRVAPLVAHARERVVGDRRQLARATAGVSTCVPGVVSVMTCASTPCSSSTVLPVRDVAMAAHHDVVVARIVDDRIAVGVVRDLERAAGRSERVEVLGRVVVIVKVDDRHE